MISLRNDLPVCAMPNGGLRRASCMTFLKLMKMPCAVSGRRYAGELPSSIAPTCVSNMRLNWRASVRSHWESSPGRLLGRLPQCASSSRSARKRSLQVLQSIERVGEARDVPGRLPDLRIEDHGGVERDHVVALLHHRAEPPAPDVVLHQDAVVAVVVRRAEAAVDLRRREDEAAPLAQRHDLVHRHRFGLVRHAGEPTETGR